MIPFSRLIRWPILIMGACAVCLCLSINAYGADNTLAQHWVDRGLEIGKTRPNSDEEAQCYRRALEADPTHASAHFNLAYVLDTQARQSWRGAETAWADMDRFYEALEHYAAAARLDPARDAAYANAIRVARLLFQTPTRRPPDLHVIRMYLHTCEEALGERTGSKAREHKKALEELVFEIERRLEVLKATRPTDELVPSLEIVRRLTRSFTRGQSPYQGPRVPLMIHFDFDSAKIRADSGPQLAELARALRRDKLSDEDILIEGHADSRGASDYNQRLSERRAASVRDYLVSRFGLSETRFKVRGYGEERPLVPNDTDEHRAMNRRVEFVNGAKLARFSAEIGHRRRSGDTDVYDLLY